MVIKNLRRGIKRAGIIATALVVIGAGAFVITSTSAKQASAVSFNVYRDCSSNSVLHCGAMTASEVQSKYNSEAGVKQIFAYYGISAADVTNLGGTAVAGYATKSGDVVVNGKVVATGAMSTGRDPISGSHAVHYEGLTFYESPDSSAFLSNTISGFVVMKNGVFQFMILASCGNPVTAKPVPPPAPKPKPASLICSNLAADKISDTEYKFTVTATNENATVTSYGINFGDGTSYSGARSYATHTYATPNTYQVQGSVAGNVNGHTVTSTGNCAASVTIPQQECKPGVPIGSPECHPKPKPKCQIPGKENLPPNSPKCVKVVTIVKHTPAPPQQPTHLVNTGPGEIVAIGLGAIAAATIGSRLFLRRRYHV